MLNISLPCIAAMTDLPDVNVWIALSVPEHPHHLPATRYWRTHVRDQVAFCRITSLGFVRVITNTAAMNGRPRAVGDAWDMYRMFRDRGDVVTLPEPAGCEAILDGWVQRGTLLPRLWTDAYLAAFALAGGLRLVTFDRDFSRFNGLDLLLLEA